MNNQTDTQDTSPSLSDKDIADIKFALRSSLVIDNDMSTEDFKQIARAIEAKCRTLRAGPTAETPLCLKCGGTRFVECGDPETGGDMQPCPLCNSDDDFRRRIEDNQSSVFQSLCQAIEDIAKAVGQKDISDPQLVVSAVLDVIAGYQQAIASLDRKFAAGDDDFRRRIEKERLMGGVL